MGVLGVWLPVVDPAERIAVDPQPANKAAETTSAPHKAVDVAPRPLDPGGTACLQMRESLEVVFERGKGAVEPEGGLD